MCQEHRWSNWANKPDGYRFTDEDYALMASDYVQDDEGIWKLSMRRNGMVQEDWYYKDGIQRPLSALKNPRKVLIREVM